MPQDSTTTDASHRPLQPPGMSGKLVTMLVVAGLVLLGIAISYTLATYNAIDDARDESARAWRSLADELAERYNTVERHVAEAVDGRGLPMEFGERFQLALDNFRTTSIVNDQAQAAQTLEELFDSEEVRNGFDSEGLQPDSELQAAIRDYNAAKLREQKLLNSLGGRVLDLFLLFTSPTSFELGGGHAP